MSVLTKERPPPQAPPPRAREDLGHRRRGRASPCSAPTGALRPADRRRRRAHAGGRQLVRARAALAGKAERTKRAGELLAERAKAAGVSEAVFDRGGYRYHGHVRAFAEAIREAGITV